MYTFYEKSKKSKKNLNLNLKIKKNSVKNQHKKKARIFLSDLPLDGAPRYNSSKDSIL